MLFAAETLKVLCEATQEFANLGITSTSQVEAAMMKHIKPLMRDVTYPDGSKLAAEFWTLKPEQTDAYRDNQIALIQWLRRFEKLPVRKQHPRLWAEMAAPLRKEIQGTLQRLVFVAHPEFGDLGYAQLRPVRFGIECVFYFALAGMLEPDSDCRVRRCQLGHNLNVEVERCHRFILFAGGIGQPPKYCLDLDHAQKHRNLKKRQEI